MTFDTPAAIAAKRTTKPDPDTEIWTVSDLRLFVRDRAYGICEWPGCGEPGDETAHVFGRGSGGRRSSNTPDNVAWLCRRHHDVLDGRTRLLLVDSAPLLRRLHTRPRDLDKCAWYCDRPATTTVATVRLCAIHEDIASGDNVPTRRAEVALALSLVVADANRSMGLRPR